jgi:SAM-dependent methyltransferase
MMEEWSLIFANNLLLTADQPAGEPKFPLRVAVCEHCWLVQITDLVPPVRLFSDYVYLSSFSETMLRHARMAAQRYIREFSLNEKSLVVEVASNDGYLLKNFVDAGVPCLGIEPAANVAEIARRNGVETEQAFFGHELARSVATTRGKANLILGNNVLAHAPEVNDFVSGLKELLAPGGRIILEFPYAGDLFANREFDTIYHEHVFYFFLTPLMQLLPRHGLDVLLVERIPIHGGSLRLVAGQAGEVAADPSVDELMRDEDRSGVSSREFYDDFSDRVAKLQSELSNLLATLKAAGASIAGYGASAKGSTLLNSLRPSPRQIDFIADRSTEKQGRFSPGLHLPILPPESLLEMQPDYTLLLTWNFADEIFAEQAEYVRRGGRFIVPIPDISIFPPEIA